jgi:hypothetical protein
VLHQTASSEPEYNGLRNEQLTEISNRICDRCRTPDPRSQNFYLPTSLLPVKTIKSRSAARLREPRRPDLIGSNFPSIHFGFRAEAEEILNPDWAASASSSLLAAVPDGGGCSFLTIRYFVYHHPDCDATFTQIFRTVIPMRYRIAVSTLSFLAPRQRQSTRPVARIKSYEERETQVYNCSIYGLRPASH